MPDLRSDHRDFGFGSDSPIVLDYARDPSTPPVLRLRWGSQGNGNEWVVSASDFDEFAEILASDIPSLLAELESLPPDVDSEAEPFFSLWSALRHQGDVYVGSYAAVPHIVRLMGTSPDPVPMTLFLIMTCIEIVRAKGRGPAMPSDLVVDDSAAMSRISELGGIAGRQIWDHWNCGAALSGVAAAKGFPKLAEAVLELDPDTVTDVLRRKFGE